MASKQIAFTEVTKIYEQSIEDVLHNSMMPYSEYVILDRALPRVEDGLKPVQRRILYAMNELGITSDKPYKKCARIVGECLGKYHPHGDRSVYDALVRMAQPFNMNMTLVDGHGNFGSVDGDSAAAMRYTEARMSSLSNELLRDLDKDTVSWSLNFDDSLKEPDTLPGRFPNLLVNGASGIAVGLATNIPPHNLVESIDATIALIDSPRMSLDELMKIIPAPDFPTGGYVVTTPELKNAYENGRGKIFLRAKAHIENDDNGKKNIVITELPYQVNKANLLVKILNLKENKKDSVLSNVIDIVDESDRKGMRAVIKVRRDGNAEAILEYLYAYTDLQISFNFNMVAIANGKPKQMGIIEMLKYYIEYQRVVIYRRTQYDLNVAKERAEIVEGLIVAITNIEKIIKIIKESSSATEAKQKMRAKFDLSEKQAQAILDMRLGRLVKLEYDKLKAELEQLKILIEEYKEILASKKKQFDVVKSELKDIKKRYKTPRCSTIVSIEDLKNPAKLKAITETVRKEGVICNTCGGLLKLMSDRAFGAGSKNITSSADLIKQAVKFNSDMNVFAFSDKGNCCRLYLSDMEIGKWKDKGFKLNSIISDCDPGEKVVKLYASEKIPEGEFFIVTANGNVKRADWSEYLIKKDCYNAITLKDQDKVVAVIDVEDGDKTMLFTTELGYCLNAEIDDIPKQGRNAGGVIGIQLSDEDKVIGAFLIDEEGEIICATDKGYIRKTLAGLVERSKRYRKGIRLYETGGRYGTKLIYSAYVKEPFDVYVADGEKAVTINTEELDIESRMSKGKQVLKSADGHVIVTNQITVEGK